ncbi:hypothetical protein PsalN5692_00390 [Piscirickettsia salmonis]|nr:hypothetical protein PsalN5692_00390 [Piscirickettsia salmonis]
MSRSLCCHLSSGFLSFLFLSCDSYLSFKNQPKCSLKQLSN